MLNVGRKLVLNNPSCLGCAVSLQCGGGLFEELGGLVRHVKRAELAVLRVHIVRRDKCARCVGSDGWLSPSHKVSCDS